MGATDWSIRQWVQKFRQGGQLSPADTPQPVAENLLERDFNATAPNQKWLTDITYISTR